MKDNLVSIIVPCYNQAEYLSETLQSVLDQKYQNWECIIVNDGSPDNTEEVALEWVNKDSRFRYLNKLNGGLADARNVGISEALGEFILPLDSDDKISPRYLHAAIETFEKDSSIKLLYPKVMLFGAKDGEFNMPPYSYDLLLWQNMIVASAMYRKSDYLTTTGYNTNMKGGWEDWDFWLSLLNRDDKVIQLPDFHFFYRIKKESMVANLNRDWEKRQKLYWQIFQNHEDLYMKEESYITCRIERDRIKNSRQYKLGCKLMAPLSYIRRILKF